MATTDLHDMNFDRPRGRPGYLGAIFASLAAHPSSPLLDASSEAAMSHGLVPRQIRLSFAWWHSMRQENHTRRNLRRLAETSPHLLRDVGLHEEIHHETGLKPLGHGNCGDLY